MSNECYCVQCVLIFERLHLENAVNQSHVVAQHLRGSMFRAFRA